MPRRMAFADLLAEKMDCRPADRPTERPVAERLTGRHIPTVNVFYAEFGATATPVADGRRQQVYATAAQTSWRPVQAPARPGRTLSPRAKVALDQLNTLGADVGEDFTADDLRHAFRILARTYHPDRHPGSSASETARLATTFVTLHSAYCELKSAAPAAA